MPGKSRGTTDRTKIYFYYVTGRRLNSAVSKTISAKSAVDCILQCMLQDDSCRSVNFRKISIHEENCVFLVDINSEMKPELLEKDDDYDYLVLLEPSRVSIHN